MTNDPCSLPNVKCSLAARGLEAIEWLWVSSLRLCRKSLTSCPYPVVNLSSSLSSSCSRAAGKRLSNFL
jgi:hypothetical protein